MDRVFGRIGKGVSGLLRKRGRLRTDSRLRAAVVEALEGRVLLSITPVQVNSASQDATAYNSSVNSSGQRTYLDSQFNTSNIVFTPGGSNTPNVVVSYNDSTALQYGTGNSSAGWAYSLDGGSSFNPAYDPATADRTLPRTTAGANPDNVLVRDDATQDIYYVTSGSGGQRGAIGANVEQIFVSTDNGAIFGSPINATAGANSQGAVDKPWMAIDNNPGAGPYRFFLAYTYYASNGDQNPTSIYIVRSTDATSWPSPPDTLSASPGSDTVMANDAGYEQSRQPDLEEVVPETGATIWAPQIVVGTDHTVYLFWLEQDSNSSTNRIMYAYSKDFYNSSSPMWSTPHQVVVYNWNNTGDQDLGINGVSQDTSNGGYSHAPPFPCVAINPVNNDIYVAYGDWGDSSGSDRGNIYVVQGQNINSGSPFWSAPTRINDDTTTTDQWQPAITVSPLGNMAFVGWYDKRNDPTNNLTIQTWGSIASISGHTVSWGTNFQISGSFNPPEGVKGYQQVDEGADVSVPKGKLGDYDTASSTYTNFYYTYTYAGNPPGGPGAPLSPAWPFPGYGQSDIQLAVIPIPYISPPLAATSLSANWVSTTVATDTNIVTLSDTSGGYFSLSLTEQGQTLTTSQLPVNASASDVQAALAALGSLGSGAQVSGGTSGPYTISIPEVLGPLTLTGTGYPDEDDTPPTPPTVTVSQPTDGSARQLTDLRQAHLTWAGPASGTSVYVQYSTANSSWQDYPTSFDGGLGAGGVTLTDVTLDSNQTYYFRIRVQNSAGATSDFIMAGLLNWTADHPALSTSLLTDSGGQATYELQWAGNPVYGLETMNVQYSSNGGSIWTDAGTSRLASYGDQAITLPDSTSYWFRIRAVDPSLSIASEVSNVVGEANDDWNLSVSDLPSGGSYEISVTLASGAKTTTSLYSDATASDIQGALGSLVGGSNVTVVGQSGYFMLNFSSSLGTEAVSIATSAGDVVVLGNIPTPHMTEAWVSYVGSSTYTFTLSWDQLPFQGAGQTSDIVHMYYSYDDVNWADWGWTYAWAGSGPVTLPTEAGTYYFRIQAEGSMGMGALSNTVEYVKPTSPPPNPTLTSLDSSEYDDGNGNTYSEYSVGWDYSPYMASPDNHDAMYVYYSTDGNTWTLWGSVGASEGGVEVSGLTAGQTYYFRVQAENIDTTSDYSNVLSG